MVTMCRTWPDLCSIHYYSGRDGDWFVMGRYWLRNPGFDFSNNGAVLGNSTNESLFADNCCRGACRLPSRRIVDNGRNCSPTIWTKMNIHRTIEQPMDSQSQIIMYYHRSWHWILEFRNKWNETPANFRFVKFHCNCWNFNWWNETTEWVHSQS
jgi:hypothetical protein